MNCLLDRLLSYSDVINRVLNSSRKIKIDELEKYVREAYVLRTKTFKWWPINESIHRFWGHCIYKIRKLDGFSLGLISECAMERMVGIQFFSNQILGLIAYSLYRCTKV